MSNNYRDIILEALLASGEYGPNQQAMARGDASDAETERFRGLTRSKRKLREGERMPKGSYALARYPGVEHAMNVAAGGNLPGGSNSIGMWMKEQSDPELEAKNRRKRQEWAMMQRLLLGGR